MFATICETVSLHMSRTTLCAENKILCELIFVIFTVTTNLQNLVPQNLVPVIYYILSTYHIIKA